jgi:hypothetical protein
MRGLKGEVMGEAGSAAAPGSKQSRQSRYADQKVVRHDKYTFKENGGLESRDQKGQ